MTTYLSLSHKECLSQVKEIILQRLPSESQRTAASKYWIIFDVDQTLLTDEKYRYLYKSRNDIFRFQYKDDHDPIQPLVDLYNWCVSIGLSMCIITGRGSQLKEITMRNLNKVGIKKCHRFYTKEGKKDTLTYKSQCRKEILDTGDMILVNIGDQESDLLIPSTPAPVYGYAQYAIKLPSTY